MAYWKCTEAVIKDDGRAVKLTFEDSHSYEYLSVTLPAETWKDVYSFKHQNNEMQTKLNKALENMCRYTVKALQEEDRKSFSQYLTERFKKLDQENSDSRDVER